MEGKEKKIFILTILLIQLLLEATTLIVLLIK